MAVYKLTYKGYEGENTPTWSRFLIPARYNYAKLTSIRFLMLFMTVSMFYPIYGAIYVYLSANPAFLATMGFMPFEIDGSFFYTFCQIQGTLSYLLMAFISPSLVSWDISNGALQLYFCRPFSRLEYVLGKLSVILPLLSVITWIPAVILFAIKSSISEWSWTTENWWLGRSVLVSMLLWCVLLSLIGLAISATVKRRVAAAAVILCLYFGGAGLAGAVNLVMGVESGSLFDLAKVVQTVWADLLRFDNGSNMTVWSAWITLGILASICLWLLNRRIRSFEVIK
jgi:ABC-2 type transport system permease protein